MEIKISKKPVKYEEAIEYLDERVHQVSQNKNEELVWFLEHKPVYTCGVNFNQKDVLDKSVKIVKTNRGGKITWHGPGQLICYFVLDISKRISNKIYIVFLNFFFYYFDIFFIKFKVYFFIDF